MVKGLALFQAYFAPHAHQYVLIGGTAATMAMDAAGLPFRATKDFDVVLHVEALDAEFGAAFWRFIDAGRYEIRQSGATGRPTYYRFQKPGDASYPEMIELFCRVPDGLVLAPGSHLTPIPIDEAVSSLSAILLDDDYYAFILAGRQEVEGLSWVGADRLIPLKAVAWLELRARAAKGEAIDARHIRKHANDVLRLAQLLSPDTRIDVSARIGSDLGRFLDGMAEGEAIDPAQLGVNASLEEMLGRIRRAYGLAGT